MSYSSESIFLFALSFTLGFCLVLMVWIFQKRRNKIIAQGYTAAGTVADIIEKKGMKGNNYYESIIRYQSSSGKVVTIKHYSMRRPANYQVEAIVALYYNPSKPEQYVLKDESRGPRRMKIIGIAGILLMITGICVLMLL